GPDTRILFDRLPLPEPAPANPIDPADRAAQVGDLLGFFWAMTPIALKYVARGNTHRAVTQLDLLLGACVQVWRLVNAPERLQAGGAHWLHPELDGDLQARLPWLGETISRRDVLDAISTLMREIEAIEPACAALGAAIPAEVAAETRRFRDAIRNDLDTPGRTMTGADHGER
ncbi:MAG TPA: hypothetical protein VD767_02050, partial [Thermomicrobiales bacterium]|nr:hypothetical protein [Thermomicrobiales bacterium]